MSQAEGDALAQLKEDVQLIVEEQAELREAEDGITTLNALREDVHVAVAVQAVRHEGSLEGAADTIEVQPVRDDLPQQNQQPSDTSSAAATRIQALHRGSSFPGTIDSLTGSTSSGRIGRRKAEATRQRRLLFDGKENEYEEWYQRTRPPHRPSCLPP